MLILRILRNLLSVGKLGVCGFPLALPSITVTSLLPKDTHPQGHLAWAQHIDEDQALEAKAAPLHWVPLQASTGVGGKLIDVSGAHREVGIS